MTTKITIDPALIENIYKSQFANTYEGYVISISNTNVVIDFNAIADAERFSLLENGVGIIVHDRTVLIDIHRFKDMAIEWCAGKGWVIRSEINWIYPDKGKVEIFEKGYIREQIRWGKEYPTRLSIELAAISFVWEQIQKEKTNER